MVGEIVGEAIDCMQAEATAAAYAAGFAEGRHQGLEEALKAVENGNCFVAADIIRVLIEESKA